jgi:hypothetical protein
MPSLRYLKNRTTRMLHHRKVKIRVKIKVNTMMRTTSMLITLHMSHTGEKLRIPNRHMRGIKTIPVTQDHTIPHRPSTRFRLMLRALSFVGMGQDMRILLTLRGLLARIMGLAPHRSRNQTHTQTRTHTVWLSSLRWQTVSPRMRAPALRLGLRMQAQEVRLSKVSLS